MFELIRSLQLNIMLGLSSVCMVVGFFALITRSLPRARKLALADLEFSAGILLYSDRLAYVYHGVPGDKGYWMVRVTNFLVFFMTISMVHAFNLYVLDLSRNEMGLKRTLLRLRVVELICGFGWLMVIISQFTGWYYTFDDNNAYQRGPGFIVCYAIPYIAILIVFSVILQNIKKLSLYISIPILLFTVIPIVASVLQALFYGVSLTNMSIVGLAIVLYTFAILEMNEKLEKAEKKALDEARSESVSVRKSFAQIVGAFANALDSREKTGRGHSRRVAEYSEMIAAAMGLNEKERKEVYYSAILYDVGKLGVSESLLVNSDHLTDSQKAELKKIPQLGGNILSSVDEMPFLKNAALYRHERFDGKGYPDGLKGEEIPLAARIVAVADFYDEMTSSRASHAFLAQGKIREMLFEASGNEFDPKVVDAMIGLIDDDADFMMRESEDESIEDADRNDITKVKKMHFDGYKQQVSDGIRISGEYVKIRFETCPDEGADPAISIPALILFDSYDRCVHTNERNIKNLHYYEYCEVWLDGHTIATNARRIFSNVSPKKNTENRQNGPWTAYEIEAVCVKDHVEIKMSNAETFMDVTVALPDSTRFVFLGVTGEHCSIRNTSVMEMHLDANKDLIPRIAPEVDYFTRKEGDIPNHEVDGYRESSTPGQMIEDGMRLMFHTKSLPVAELVQHCPYVLIYASDDGTVKGKNYREFACIRLDGENVTQSGKGKNELIVNKSEDFAGWDYWKEKNKRGLDVEVFLRRKKNRIHIDTENVGISVECTTTVPKNTGAVYVALTGNLCALSDIRYRF